LALALALPYWNVFTPPLQAATAFVATGLLGPLGVAAQVDGGLVELEYRSFVIAANCAGLAFFVSGAAIGYLYGLLSLSRWRDRVLAVGPQRDHRDRRKLDPGDEPDLNGHASEMQSSRRDARRLRLGDLHGRPGRLRPRAEEGGASPEGDLGASGGRAEPRLAGGRRRDHAGAHPGAPRARGARAGFSW
jgi:hypothetical protein